MAKHKQPKRKATPAAATSSGYDRVRATITEGQLEMSYRVTGADRNGGQSHDEDVSSWTDDDIQKLVCQLLDIDLKFKDEVQVEWN